MYCKISLWSLFLKPSTDTFEMSIYSINTYFLGKHVCKWAIYTIVWKMKIALTAPLISYLIFSQAFNFHSASVTNFHFGASLSASTSCSKIISFFNYISQIMAHIHSQHCLTYPPLHSMQKYIERVNKKGNKRRRKVNRQLNPLDMPCSFSWDTETSRGETSEIKQPIWLEAILNYKDSSINDLLHLFTPLINNFICAYSAIVPSLEGDNVN